MNNHFSFQAIAFDMDGVLIESKKIIEYAWTKIAFDYDVKISEEDIKNYIHGRTGEETLKIIFKNFSLDDKMRIKKLVDSIEEASSYNLVQGIREFIKKLSDQEIQYVLVTSSWPEKIAFVLKEHKLENSFVHVINKYHVIHPKPEPDCYLLAAKKLNISPKNMVVFEDSMSGIQSAVRSGAICIGVNEESMEKYGVHATIKNFSDIDFIRIGETLNLIAPAMENIVYAKDKAL